MSIFAVKALKCAVAATLLGAALNASASVVITGTRVIYPQSSREVTVRLTNDGKTPALVQTWIDNGDSRTLPGEAKVPFAIVPPLFRLDAGKGQSLRLLYTNDPLPADRESLFWLNVLEVPPHSKAQDDDPNRLRLAFRNRIKLFFRPDGLTGDPRDAPAKVTWKFVARPQGGYALQASNPTPYHVTFTRVQVQTGGAQAIDDKGGMVAPGGTHDFNVGDVKAPPAGEPEVDYTYLDDYGAGVRGHAGPAGRK